MTAQGTQQSNQFALAAQQANEEAERAKAVLGSTFQPPSSGHQPSMTSQEWEQGQEYLTQFDNDIERRQQGYVESMQAAGAFAKGFRPAGYETPQVQQLETITGTSNPGDDNPERNPSDQNTDMPESWNLVGGPDAERNLANQLQQSNSQNPPGAPGGLGHS